MNKSTRTPLFIILACISVSLIPWVNNLILDMGSVLYRVSHLFFSACLLGPLILVVGIMQCLEGKESVSYRSGIWYMIIGTIMITYAISFSFYSIIQK
jgi:hypothetical protein